MINLLALKQILPRKKPRQDGNGQPLSQNLVIESSSAELEFTSLSVRKMTYQEACESLHQLPKGTRTLVHLSPNTNKDNLRSMKGPTPQATRSISQSSTKKISDHHPLDDETSDDDNSVFEEDYLEFKGPKWDRFRRNSRGHYI